MLFNIKKYTIIRLAIIVKMLKLISAKKYLAPLAQLVEQIPFKDKVIGSSPIRGTSIDSSLISFISSNLI